MRDRLLGQRASIQLIAFKTQMVTADYEAAWQSADRLEALGESVPESYRRALEKHPR